MKRHDTSRLCQGDPATTRRVEVASAIMNVLAKSALTLVGVLVRSTLLLLGVAIVGGSIWGIWATCSVIVATLFTVAAAVAIATMVCDEIATIYEERQRRM